LKGRLVRRAAAAHVLASVHQRICTPEKYEQMLAAYGARAVNPEMLVADAATSLAPLKYPHRSNINLTMPALSQALELSGDSLTSARPLQRIPHLALARYLFASAEHSLIGRGILSSLRGSPSAASAFAYRLSGPMGNPRNAGCQRLSPFSAGSVVCHILRRLLQY